MSTTELSQSNAEFLVIQYMPLYVPVAIENEVMSLSPFIH